MNVLVIDTDADPEKKIHTHDGVRMRRVIEAIFSANIEYCVNKSEIPWDNIEKHAYKTILVHLNDIDRTLATSIKKANACVVGLFSGGSPTDGIKIVNDSSRLIQWQITNKWLDRLEKRAGTLSFPEKTASVDVWLVFISSVLLISNEVDVLSAAIHSLENLILPLRADCKTLEEIPRADPDKIAKEIWCDYFAGIAEGSFCKKATEPFGYLHEKRKFEAVDEPGLENCILNILHRDTNSQTAAQFVRNRIQGIHTEKIPSLGKLVGKISTSGITANELASALKMNEARNIGMRGYKKGKSQLLKTLADVVKKVDNIIKVLRWARDVAKQE